MTDHELQLKAVALRRAMLQLIVNAGAGHTGGGLSCLDILNVLYNRVLHVSPQTFGDPHARPLRAEQGPLRRGALRRARRPRLFPGVGLGHRLPLPIALRRPSHAAHSRHRDEHRRARSRPAHLHRHGARRARWTARRIASSRCSATANSPKARTGKPAWPPRITSWITSSPSSTTTRSRSPATRAT